MLRTSIPNLLTASRLVLAVVAFRRIRKDRVESAVLLLTSAAITDCLDGVAARKFNATSEFGKHFDPTADRGLFYVSLFALHRLRASPLPVLALLGSREFLLATGAPISIVRRIPPPGVGELGKVSTALFLVGAQLAIFGTLLNRRMIRTIGNVSLIGSVPFGYLSLFKSAKHVASHGRRDS